MIRNIELTFLFVISILAGITHGEAQQAKPQAPVSPARAAVGAPPDCAESRDVIPVPDDDDEGVRNMPRLMRAAAAGDIEQVRGLLAGGTRPDEKEPALFTALMLAAAAGHLDVVKALLDAGADPNAAGGVYHAGSWSVLTMAMNRCNGNWAEVVDALMAGGAKVNPAAGPIPLAYAVAQRRDLVLIRALLERGADINLHGGAPLRAAVAVAEPDVEVVKALLTAGADPNLPRLGVGEEEVSLLAYLEQYIENSRGGERDKTDEAREEIVRLLRQAGAKH